MKRFLPLLALVVAIPAFAHAQSPSVVVIPSNDCADATPLNPGVGRPLIETNAGLLCTSASATGTFTDDATGTTGSTVPASASYGGMNVGGNLRGQTGVNPSGSIFAAQVDLASVAGATVKTGNGTSTGAQRVTLASDSTGQVLLGGNSFSDISTATTTTVKSAAGTLNTITINTFVASATITIYDNTAASGTKIATITLPSTITGDAPTTLTYNLAFSTGLTIVTSDATDLTISYR